jgi:hypothetical protein
VTAAWPARLSVRASAQFKLLAPEQQEQARGMLDIASRGPWDWPAWAADDPEGEDLRVAAVGPLMILYWVARPMGYLRVMDITAPGLPEDFDLPG